MVAKRLRSPLNSVKAPRRRAKKPETVHETAWQELLQSGSGDARRLDSVIRFSSIPVTFSESTAAHSFWVSFYSLMIWQMLESFGWKKALPPLEEVLRYAIVHDLGESVTGDVVRTLKYSSEDMRAQVDASEKLLVDRLLPYYVRRTIPDSFSPGVKDIVKAADFLSLWQFMRREAARHNLEILPYYMRMVEDLRSMVGKADPMLSALYEKMVSEAEEIAKDCFGEFCRSGRWTRRT